MKASIGADDLDPYETPRPDVLRALSGIEPEPSGVHVLLGDCGVRSTQRLALLDVGGGLAAAFWPAELKAQAKYLYGERLATPMIAAARERGWIVRPSPHIGFFNSDGSRRLYMRPELDGAEYAHRWETTDLEWVRQYDREEVEPTLWPWLKERGYADDDDDRTLSDFLTRVLGRRPAHMRPGLRFKRSWDPETVRRLGSRAVGDAIREDVNAIFEAAGEPDLPAAR